MVLAIMYLISWKKKNISVKMLVKAVIAQFLIAVILVKVPAGRYVVSKVSDAVTSVINCGQDGLSFVFGSLADSTAAAISASTATRTACRDQKPMAHLFFSLMACSPFRNGCVSVRIFS